MLVSVGLIIFFVSVAAATPWQTCSVDTVNLVFVVDETVSSMSVKEQLEGESGVMKSVFADTLDGSSLSTFSFFPFQDKSVSPFGTETDDCFGPYFLLATRDASTVADINVKTEGGGDSLNAQLDGVLLAGETVKTFLDILRDGSGSNRTSPPSFHGMINDKSEWPSRMDVEASQNVIVLLTTSMAHQQSDGPAGLPLPPSEVTYNCNTHKYPTIEQINNLLLAENFKFVVLTESDYQTFYQSLFSGLTVPWLVTTVGPTAADTLINLEEALHEVVCRDCLAEYFDLQVLHLQDVSASYSNDLPNIQSLIPAVASSLQSDFHEAEFGLGVFSDKPVSPFGQVGVDVCYVPLSPFSSDISFLSSALGTLKTVSGMDWKESQLDALYRGALDTSLGWYRGFYSVGNIYYRLRVLILATDAGYHQKGDWSAASPSRFTRFRNVNKEVIPDCETSDYNSVADTVVALEDNFIFPLFLATNDVITTYTDLLTEMNIGRGSVRRLEEDSANIVEAIKDGINDVCIQATGNIRRLSSKGKVIAK